jgi:hypothetical protein
MNKTEQNRTEQNIDAQIQALCALYNSIVAPFILVETVSHS